MYWQVGDSFRALDTQEVKACGIETGAAGRVDCVQGAQVGFTVAVGSPGKKPIRGRADLGTFNRNFALAKAKESARQGKPSAAALHPQRFPQDFRRASARG